MKILSLVVPGRFPTIVPDTGKWWSSISDLTQHTLSCYSLNFSWWHTLCSPKMNQAIQLWENQNKTTTTLNQIEAEKMALAANESLNKLTLFKTYNSSSRYIETI